MFAGQEIKKRYIPIIPNRVQTMGDLHTTTKFTPGGLSRSIPLSRTIAASDSIISTLPKDIARFRLPAVESRGPPKRKEMGAYKEEQETAERGVGL